MAVNQVIFSPGILIIVVLALLAVASLVLLIVVITGGHGEATSTMNSHSPQSAFPEREGRLRRTQILKQLAARELSKEEAEMHLRELGDPSHRPPSPPSIRPSSGGRGCVVALLIAIGLGILLLGLLMFGLMGTRKLSHQVKSNQGHHQQIEQWASVPRQPMKEKL